MTSSSGSNTKFPKSGYPRSDERKVRSPSGSGHTGPRDAAMWGLIRVHADGAYLDRIISDIHRRAGEDPRDQNLAEAIVKGVLENQVALENLLRPLVEKFDRSSHDLRAALFVGAAQLKVLTAVPDHAAVSETVNAARRLLGPTRAGLVNAVMRRVSASTVPIEQLSSIPMWVNSRITAQYKEQGADLLEALDRPIPLFVRVNPLRSSVEKCIASLAEVGVSAVPFELMPGMLALDLNGARIPEKVFAEGICTVQDPSAALVALALNPQPGEAILDLCSAPGGKTTHIAEIMGDRGDVLATDINEKKLALVQEHASRLGLNSISVQQLDGTAVGAKLDGRQFDRVLLDAPCTGTGVFSKKRDALARKKESDLHKLIETQRVLLSNARNLVRPNGGILVYSTCSLDFAENEEQTAWFLKEFPEYKLVTAHPLVPAGFVTMDGFIKALPQLHGCAGGFAAVFRRD